MPVRQTSVEAFHALPDRKIAENERRVLSAIVAMGQATDLEISRWLQWPINRVTPRRGNLVKKGLVEAIGKKMDVITKCRGTLWRAAT